MNTDPVLVVWTTWDYVDMIRRAYPGAALFLTDPGERQSAFAPAPPVDEEILHPFGHWQSALAEVRGLCDRRGIRLGGIVAFDCPSLNACANLARELGLPFATPVATDACRDKAYSKLLLRKAGVDCPRSSRVESAEDAVAQLRRLDGPMILKPVRGTGGSGVSLCRTDEDARRGFERAMAEAEPGDSAASAEEYVPGPEYSCDFILDEAGLRLARVACKYKAPGDPVGRTRAYMVCHPEQAPIDTGALAASLAVACRALGLRRAMGMADFLWRDGGPCFLEITPRPGGDCLPLAIRHACGLDTVAAAMAFARGEAVALPPASAWRPTAGMQVYDPFDPAVAEAVPEILEVVEMPPNLDHRVADVIFRPVEAARFGQEALDILRALHVERAA